MNSSVGMFFDIIILAALAGTIYYSFRLSRQFNDLKADRKAFETLIQALNLAASKAEGAIRGLKEAATGTASLMQEKINTARELSDELELMIQAGDNLAERLQNAAVKTRTAASSDEDNVHVSGDKPRTRAERDLIEALKAKQKS